MNKWWWVGLFGVVVVMVVVAVGRVSPTPVPTSVPTPVVETESMVDRQGRLVENEPGTARVGYGLVMENQEKLFLDLSEFTTASTAGYLNRQVTVRGPIIRNRLYDPATNTQDETETRYMLVKEINLAP
jgi:hypothetical protein